MEMNQKATERNAVRKVQTNKGRNRKIQKTWQKEKKKKKEKEKKRERKKGRKEERKERKTDRKVLMLRLCSQHTIKVDLERRSIKDKENGFV